MTLIEAIILGILQGLTEFLPVSSSGHLVLAEHILGIDVLPQDLLGFDVLLHAGSLGAVMVFYRRVWWRMLTGEQMLLLKIIIGTIPAGLLGWWASDMIGTVFHTVLTTSVLLGVTGCVLLHIDLWRPLGGERSIRWRDAVFIGGMQAVALLPGVSRSGMTIAGGYLCGLRKEKAVDFSFLLSAPIIAGAALHTMRGWWIGELLFPSLTVSVTGVIVSFMASILSIGFMRFWVQKGTLAPFGMYLWIISVIGIIVSIVI